MSERTDSTDQNRPPAASRTDNIQVAAISSVGRGVSWPQFTFTLEENDNEQRGGRFQIVGADRKQAIEWLRSAADAIELGTPLRISSFEVNP